jgi:hypothetical protein
LIVACNKEVLEDRHPEESMKGRQYKEFDYTNMTVSWKPDVYEFYRKHPERFAEEHPLLRLGEDRRIGKAVTFFVDQSLYDVLRQIPAHERVADLRLVTTPADLALAIMASVSEPTYFDPVPDPEPGKVLALDRPGDLGNIRQRIYYGGYIMHMPAQDVRRMLPGIRVMGTGFRHFSSLPRRMMREWLLADVEPIAELSEWWADLETLPTIEFERHMAAKDLPAEQEFEFGRRIAADCLDRDQGLPMFVLRPRYCYPADKALFPENTDEVFTGRTLDHRRRELKTLRGMGPLLDRP